MRRKYTEEEVELLVKGAYLDKHKTAGTGEILIALNKGILGGFVEVTEENKEMLEKVFSVMRNIEGSAAIEKITQKGDYVVVRYYLMGRDYEQKEIKINLRE